MHIHIVNPSTGVPVVSLCSRGLSAKPSQYVAVLAAIRSSFMQAGAPFELVSVSNASSDYAVVYFDDDIIIEDAPSMRVAQQIRDIVRSQGKAAYNSLREVCDRLCMSKGDHPDYVFGLLENTPDSKLAYAVESTDVFFAGPVSEPLDASAASSSSDPQSQVQSPALPQVFRTVRKYEMAKVAEIPRSAGSHHDWWFRKHPPPPSSLPRKSSRA
ncbi:putative mitochondrial protein [Andalucia godoyi]|uniref:Putative mitochondrial protein n=1 Tax=Andalucia godoyi TaxID=505711 RepID=A0A8K0F2A3_ANDGO|nr:putative mitochondrial protein [Andalucia godoyi]|eukprot:ANDGO_08585.mRNA.1 putative mitochondrial protein